MVAARFYSSSAVQTTIVNPISAGAVSVQVVSITGYPVSTPFTIVFEVGTSNEEIAEVTAVAGTTFTVNRGVDGSSALSHTAGAQVVHGISARDLREPQEHIGNNVGVHGLGASTPVVGTDTVQTLTNKTLTSPVLTAPSSTGGTLSAPAITNPAITGGGSWAGSPSLTAPAITNPTITGGGSWAGSPVLTSPTINTGGTWNGSPTIVTPTIASHINAGHDHSAGAGGGNVPQANITGLSTRLTNIESVNTTQDTNIANNTTSINTLKTPPYAVLWNSINQSIPDSTVTAVTFNREDFKSPAGVHSNTVSPSQFSAPISGLYQVSVSIPWQLNATGIREVTFRINNTTSWAGVRTPSTSGIILVQSATHLIPLIAGDWVEVMVYQSSGVALNIDSSYATGQRFEIAYIRAIP